MKKTILIPALLLVAAAAFLAGRFLPASSQRGNLEVAEEYGQTESETIWTCSMHPQIRQPGPGICPLCAMDLIPISDEDEGEERDLPRLRLSERSIALMNIQTAPAQHRRAYAEVNLPGVVAIDDSRKAIVSAWFSGRVDRLFVDATGIRVLAGEHLAEIFSPRLYSAQEELLQALRARQTDDGGAHGSLVEAARTKLKLLGLTAEQIDSIAAAGAPTTHLIYHSPVEGTVLERHVTAGQYVETGTPLHTIADLSRVWVNLEAFESDLRWLRFGQEVTLETVAFPGETFAGRVTFIEPEINPARRTARVRVNLANEERRLKPGMLVSAKIRARVGDGGVVSTGHFEGKWISPMHPEIVKEGPGECDVCGMDLVPVEEMGFFAATSPGTPDPLVIPATAPLLTGKRALVYVRTPNGERPTFEAREVVLGQRLGDLYPVKSGLREGDLVVVHGQFKIDSELQIRGRPSMMSPTGDPLLPAEPAMDPRAKPVPAPFAGEVDADFGAELVPLFAALLRLTAGLAADDTGAAVGGLAEFRAVLMDIGPHRLEGKAHEAWMERHRRLDAISGKMGESFTLEHLRSHLQEITTLMEQTHVDFGAGQLPVLKRAHCPMVEGGVEIGGKPIGTWLQAETPLANPYWGAAMLRCGEFHGQLGNS